MRDEHPHSASEERADSTSKATDGSNPPAGGRAAATPEQETLPSGSRRTPVPTHPDPTRYGDWEKAGRCIDF